MKKSLMILFVRAGIGFSSIIILFFLIVSCHEKKESVVNAVDHTSEKPTEKNVIIVDGDISFEKNLDTVSQFGPHSITRNVIESGSGAIWIASWEGIISFDGNTFTNHTLKERLRQYHVFSILEDLKGNLWFGMIGGGVYRYDGNSFVNFTTENKLADNTVFCMLEDKKGNIWFGTNNGASCFNGTTFINYTTQHGLSNNSIQSMTLDRSGSIWFGTNGGISLFNGTGFSNFHDSEGKTFNNVKALLTDRNGNIYIAEREGLFFFDGEIISKLSSSLIGSVFEDLTGNIWLTGGGANSPDVVLTKYNPLVKNRSAFTEIISGNEKGISGEGELNKQVFGITADKAGNMWFGTAKGICMYNGKSFTTYLKTP